MEGATHFIIQAFTGRDIILSNASPLIQYNNALDFAINIGWEIQFIWYIKPKKQ